MFERVDHATSSGKSTLSLHHVILTIIGPKQEQLNSILMSGIVATSQQTRFDPASVNATEIDLRDVSISIGKTEVLQDARILLKSGTRYGLIGPNGSGKSSESPLTQSVTDDSAVTSDSG